MRWVKKTWEFVLGLITVIGFILGVITYLNEDSKKHDKVMESQEVCGETIEIEHDDAMAYNNKGNVYFDKQEYDSAIECYKKAIELVPDYAIAYCNLGAVYLVNGDEKKGIEFLTKAAELGNQDAQQWLKENGKND